MKLPWNKTQKVPESKKDSINFRSLGATIDKIFKDTEGTREEMTRFLKRYKGEWWDKSKLKDSDSTIQANLFFSTVMTVAPLLTDNRPIWGVRARKPFMQNYIDGLSLGTEYLWDKLDMDMNVFKWVIDALIMKVGILKCYFNPDMDVLGEISVEIVDPRNFFVSPGYEDIWDAPFCGIRVTKPLSWIRTSYPENGEEVKPSEGEVSDHAEAWELDTAHAQVYEVWLRDQESEDYFVNGDGKEVEKDTEGAKKEQRSKYPYGRMVVFTKDVLLDDKPYPYKHGKPPYVALYDYLVPHDWVGMGEGNQIEELNKAFNRNLQLMDRWTNNYCDPPWLVDTNAGIDVESVKETLPNGGGIYEFNGMNSQEPIKKVQSPPLDQTVAIYQGNLMKLTEEISGVTDVTKGMTSKSQRQSATEISTLIESSYTRTRQRVRNLEWSIKRVLYLILENIQQYYTEPRTFSIKQDNTLNYYTIGNSKDQVGQMIKGQEEQSDQQESEDYAKFLEEYGNEDSIYAAFDLDIQTNSTLPMDKQSLANLLLRLLQIAAGNPVTGMPIWEAVLAQLRIPKYKDIIAQMKDLFEKGGKPQGQPGAPQGPESLMAQLQRSTQ